MHFSGNERPLLIVHRSMQSKEDSIGEYDLLLAPSFYLMREEKLPVRFPFEAKRLAPSMMEEMGAGSDWAFETLREGESWMLFAFDPKEVESRLQKAGFDPGKARRLYFAQQFAKELETPLALGDGEVLVTMNGIVSILPKQLLRQEPERWTRIEDLSRPEKSFPARFGQTGGWLEARSMGLLWAAFLLLALAWMAEGVRSSRVADAFDRQFSKIASGSPALSSGITRRNIHDRYAAIDRHQREIRQTLRKIGRLISKESKLSSLQFDEKGYVVEIDTKNSKVNTLRKLAEAEGFSATVKGNQLLIRGRWEP